MTSDHHITRVLDPSDQLPADTLQWLCDGMAAYLKTGEPLHKCLNINRRQYLQAKRNRHLCKAFDCLDPRRSVRYRCQMLLNAINEFMKTWNDYDGDDPDPAWSPLEKEIFNVLRCRLGYPDYRMLRDIVSEV